MIRQSRNKSVSGQNANYRMKGGMLAWVFQHTPRVIPPGEITVEPSELEPSVQIAWLIHM
ncbi:hypothetical protein CCR75_003137 [Bremia lactucae]|uniref:Uncharacterized protein n=1 Tax=Bremia lactucae TaxID=4779 RepID=A0A976FHJ5_BRELC|nr:hypothetical protein CCR75_003137 [Bremia lactucae]